MDKGMHEHVSVYKAKLESSDMKTACEQLLRYRLLLRTLFLKH